MPRSRRKKGRDIHGILLLDKRIGVSSNKALQEVKHLYMANKAGHTGSLDPLASGLLPVCFGEATKVSTFMLDEDKRYQVVIQLGIVTDTGDAEGQILAENEVPIVSDKQIEELLQRFTGDLQQVPPMYSALKHQGRKLYELARAGKTVPRQPRKITIYDLQCLANYRDRLTLDVHCSKGTYIRSLAEDIGDYLGCGATVMELRRTAAGQFSLTTAYPMEQLNTLSEPALDACLLPVDQPLLSFPDVTLTQQQACSIKYGQKLAIQASTKGLVRMYNEQNFLGLGEMAMDGTLAPKKLFNLV